MTVLMSPEGWLEKFGRGLDLGKHYVVEDRWGLLARSREAGGRFLDLMLGPPRQTVFNSRGQPETRWTAPGGDVVGRRANWIVIGGTLLLVLVIWRAKSVSSRCLFQGVSLVMGREVTSRASSAD